jgi:hypothetical protein
MISEEKEDLNYTITQPDLLKHCSLSLSLSLSLFPSLPLLLPLPLPLLLPLLLKGVSLS